MYVYVCEIQTRYECISVTARVCVDKSALSKGVSLKSCLCVCECKGVRVCFHLALTLGTRGLPKAVGNLFLVTDSQESFLPMPRPLLCLLQSP